MGEMRSPVGAALCRERGAERPQDFCNSPAIAGAALRPFRGTRPLLQRACLPVLCICNKDIY
ncbi:hypothetical protein E8E78_24780 [Pseudomonas sp. BN505]|nr:hypothetical protein [Pseudomonas sp. BN605]MDH4859771.1 hypothetical protein [Pseudomonas sp. BN505]